MAADLAVHDDVVTGAILEDGGEVFSRAGDSFAAAFPGATQAVRAAVAAQRALARAQWVAKEPLQVRMGLHLGEAQRRSGDFFGPCLNECARIMATAHGGQIVVSEAVAGLVADVVPLLDLGRHRLRDLADSWHLHQVLIDGLPNDHPPLRSLPTSMTTLPTRPTRLIGREALLTELARKLHEHRLVTLLGPGGAGKTHTAVEAAGRRLHDHSDGVYFVDLTRARSERDVVTTWIEGLATAVIPGRTPEAHLIEHLQDKDLLLVLDNCEHVIDRVAEVAQEVLRAAPGVRVIATSREPLELPGEQVCPIPPLDAGEPDSAAVRLFVERALAANGSVTIDDPTVTIIAELTRRLDGMPLAIELAAARTRSLTPAQILDHLDDRFRLLTSGGRRADRRQATLQGAIDWSYQLLDNGAQRTFRVLSMCAGGFSLPTATRLLGVDEVDALDQLDSLCAKSLLTPSDGPERVRGYRMLETIREYGRLQLGSNGELADAERGLEAALLPPPPLLEHPSALLTEHIEWNDEMCVEVTTRLAAAETSLHAGRRDSAALILGSSTAPQDPHAHQAIVRGAAALLDHADGLTPLAWYAAAIAKMSAETFMGRHLGCAGDRPASPPAP